MLPRHVGVLHALKDADGDVELDGRVKDLPSLAILDQGAGDGVGLIIVRGPLCEALFHDL